MEGKLGIFKRNSIGALLAIDYLILTISFFIAVFTRYNLLLPILGSVLVNSLYQSLYLSLVLVYLLVFFIRKEDNSHIAKHSLLETFFVVLKNQLYFGIGIIVLLFIMHIVGDISRTVLGIFFITNFLGDIVSRTIYKNYLIKWKKNNQKVLKSLLISNENDYVTTFYKLNDHDLRNHNGISAAHTDIKYISITDNENGDKVIDGVEFINVKDISSINLIKYGIESVIIDRNVDFDFLKKNIDIFNLGVPIHIVNGFEKYAVGTDMIQSLGNCSLTSYTGMFEKDNVIGIDYAVSNIPEAVMYVKKNTESLKGKYICFSNAHTSVMSYDDPEYRDVQNGAAITFPDGASVVKQQQRHGHIMSSRVAGPDFMTSLFVETMDGSKTHFFYGSTKETLEKLKENVEKKYPGIKIVGTFSPPFRKLDEDENENIINMINDSGADYLWVALGAPKQEKWMAQHKGKINAVMFGVGAAFDFHAGTIKRAPIIVQKMGMEWLYRLFQDPKRLIKRYFITNLKFMLYTFIADIKKK